MRLEKTACLFVAVTMLTLSPSTVAQIRVEPDQTDLPPPIVLQQKGVSAEEYTKALADNRYVVVPNGTDVPAYAPSSAGSAEAVELTAEAHQAMMAAARAAGRLSPVTTQTVKSHIQGDSDRIPGQNDIALRVDGAPLVAPHPASAPPALGRDTRANGRATGDQVRNFATIANSGWIPPDTQIGVGGGYVVSATNSHYAIYDLNGNLQTAPLNSFATFFGPALPAGWAGNLFDPKVVYNPWNGRWVMLVLGVDFTNQQSFYFIAFSQTSNPNGSWWLYATNNNSFATDSWLDYSGLAVDPWGVYTSGNMFRWAGGFRYAMVRHHDNDGFSGGTLNWWTRWNLQWPSGSLAFTVQPALAHSQNGLNGGTTFFVNTFSGSGNRALLWKLSGHTGPDAPAGTLTSTEITIDQYYAIGGNVDQPGSATDIDGGDARVLNAVYSQNNVYATLTNDLNNNADRAAAYTFRLDTNANTKEWAHNLHAEGWYYTYPAVTIKGFGGDAAPVGVFMTITHDDVSPASDFFPSAGVKLYQLPETDNSGAFEIFRTGQAAYVNFDSNNRNRWGDYSGAAYDWACPGRMWGGAEFSGTSNTWGTQAAAYMMDNSNTACSGSVPNQVETSSPDGDTTDSTPTFTWIKPAGDTVTGFRLIVQKAGVTQYSLVLSTLDASCDTGSGCSYTPTNTLTLGAHTFTVEANNSIGFGPASNPRSFNVIAPPPANDGFTNAAFIGGGSVNGTLVGATNDGSTSGAGAGEPDVWYRYSPIGPGTLRVNTCGSQTLSGLDTVLSVHNDTGGAGTAANQVALNDDWQGSGGDPDAACPGIRDSSLAVSVAAGQDLLIRVSRFSSATDGEFVLNVAFELAPPQNDSYADSIDVGSGGGSQQGTLLGATRDGSSSADSPSFPSEADVWYGYVAAENGTLRVDTCGSLDLSNINTVLSVHSDTGVAGTVANELAANDDWGVGGDPVANCPSIYDSSLALALAGGQAVLIRVSRGDDIGGLEFNLNVSFEADPEPDTDGDGIVDSADNCTLVPNDDQRDTNGDGFGNICDADLDNNGIVNAIDLGLFKSVFFAAGDLDADFNGDGIVNAIDLGIFKAGFFAPPGPSGLVP